MRWSSGSCANRCRNRRAGLPPARGRGRGGADQIVVRASRWRADVALRAALRALNQAARLRRDLARRHQSRHSAVSADLFFAPSADTHHHNGITVLVALFTVNYAFVSWIPDLPS